ncbi:MAG: signal peptidase II [archaeon]
MKLKRLITSAIIVIIIDQLTKILLTKKQYNIFGINLINYTENTGAAFSILEGYRWLFITVSSIAIIILLYYATTLGQEEKKLEIPLGILIGGMAGNLIDRILLGYVRDFIDLQIWAIFNLADTAVFMAIIILCVYLIRKSFRKTTYH